QPVDRPARRPRRPPGFDRGGPGRPAARRPAARPLGRAGDARQAYPGGTQPARGAVREASRNHHKSFGIRILNKRKTMSETFNLVVVSAGTSDPSSTKLLADRTAQRVTALAERRGATVRTQVIDLRELATDITTALTSQLVTPKLTQAVDALGMADGI